jgi:hypothetical protein
VDDSLAIAKVDWQTLDVVRWAALEVDVSGLEKELEATQCIRDALTDAVAEAEGRLLAIRITLTGSTPLHGVFHREAMRLRAEVLAIAQDFGEESVWIERITMETTPVYDLTQLAERDTLTGTVLKTLEGASQGLELVPDDIKEMLALLPTEVRPEVEKELEGENLTGVIDDVRSIILETLKSKGGQAA